MMMTIMVAMLVMMIVDSFSALYQITHLGDDDDEPEFTSTMAEQLEEGTTFFFSPRDLKNLVLVDEMESLSPMMHCQVNMKFL